MIYAAEMMKSGAAGIGLAGSMLVACGPDAVVEAELGEVCGAPSPFRVLKLEPDEVLMTDRPLRVLDRVFYLVKQRGEDEPGATLPAIAGTTVWATGPCGESPVLVATGIESIFTQEVWPDVVLGCEEVTGSVVALDPAGVKAPHVVFPEIPHTYGCGLRWTPYGVLSVEERDAEQGALRLHPYPADPRTETAAPVVLLDPIRLGPSHKSGTFIFGDVLRSFEEFVLALTPDDTLVRVELADGSVSTLRENVAAIEASREGHYVLMQDATITRDDPNYPEGEVFLRDLDEGSDPFLHETAIAYNPFSMNWADEGLVLLGLGNIFTSDLQRAFFLPGLEHADVPADLFINAKLDEDHWLGGSLWDSHYAVFDLRKGDRRSLFTRDADVVHRDADALELLELPQCCVDGNFRDEGPVWRVPIDGGAPQRLARRATRRMSRLDDGRFVSPMDLDARWLGPLMLIEPGSDTEQRVDERVFAFSIDPSRVKDEGIVSYSVSDGERSGVYLARLPPSERSRAAPVPQARVETLVVDVMQGSEGRRVQHPRFIADDTPHGGWSERSIPR